MKTVVVRNIQRADSNAIGTFEALGTATVHEALGRSGLMKPYLRPIYAGAQIAGPAVTVLAQPGDNWMLHVAIEQCREGDVVVVGCTADNTDGCRRTTRHLDARARRQGADHRCRLPRREAAARHGLPGLVEGHFGQGHGEGDGRRGQRPVVCAGVMSSPATRSWPTTTASWWCRINIAWRPRKAQKRFDDEDGKRQRLASGELGLDMYKMREALEKAGLRYVDKPEDASAPSAPLTPLPASAGRERGAVERLLIAGQYAVDHGVERE